MRVLLLLAAAVFSVHVNAQYFSLRENGLVPNQDVGKNYIVIQKEGKTQKQLFEQVKAFVQASYVSPSDVMNAREYDMITLNGVSRKDVVCKVGFGVLPFVTNYTVTFLFKDGKIRVNTPVINSMTATSYTARGKVSGFYELVPCKGSGSDKERKDVVIFKKNGKTTKGAKESIEGLFNSLVDRAVNFQTSTEEEW